MSFLYIIKNKIETKNISIVIISIIMETKMKGLMISITVYFILSGILPNK